MTRDIQTLEQFMSSGYTPDGHYSVWKSGMMPDPREGHSQEQ
jgi:hypothetical protein